MRRYNPNIKPSSSSNDIVLLKLEFEFELEFEFNVNGIEFEKRVIGAVSLSLLLSQTQRQHQGQLFWEKDRTKTTLPVCTGELPNKEIVKNSSKANQRSETISPAKWFQSKTC
jgi:hypothetical protein